MFGVLSINLEELSLRHLKTITGGVRRGNPSLLQNCNQFL